MTQWKKKEVQPKTKNEKDNFGKNNKDIVKRWTKHF